MDLNVVDVAAWIIVGKTAGEFFLHWQKNQHEKLEKAAVVAEYDASVDAEYSVDETLARGEREMQLRRHRDRQQRLLMRYPQHLIPAPQFRYFKAAREAD
jgi:hypothetical protein